MRFLLDTAWPGEEKRMWGGKAYLHLNVLLAGVFGPKTMTGV